MTIVHKRNRRSEINIHDIIAWFKQFVSKDTEASNLKSYILMNDTPYLYYEELQTRTLIIIRSKLTDIS